MAVYFLRSTHLSRGKGARATRAAAYRAGERIRDQRTGETHDHSNRQDVLYKEVVLPDELAGREDLAWTQDRSTLWNAAEHAGLRCNSRVARELLVILPSELTVGQRNRLARDFARELATRYTVAVDLCIHLPRPGADARNHHAHLLMTVREVGPDGLGSRSGLEIDAKERAARGMPITTSKAEYLRLRERWADLTNTALRQAGLSARVDHRSFARQGLNREAGVNLPEKVFYAERKLGRSTAAGDAIRARYRERVEARQQGPEALARVLARQQAERLADLARKAPRPPRRELTPEERRARARRYYRNARERLAKDPAALQRQREVARQAYHRQKQQNRQLLNERQNQRRAANRTEVNRKQREWRRSHAAELNTRRRELRRLRSEQQHAPLHVPKPPVAEPVAKAPAVDSGSDWLAYRERHGRGPSAQDSLHAWQAYRERQAQGVADKSRGAEDTDLKPGRDRGPAHSL